MGESEDNLNGFDHDVTDYSRVGWRRSRDFAPDGRFLINVTTEDATNTPITLLLNLKPLVK